MAVTITETRAGNGVLGKVVIGVIQFDSSYPTGGEAIDWTVDGTTDFTAAPSHVLFFPPETSTGAVTAKTTCAVLTWDRANAKVVAHAADGTNGLTEVANATDLSAVYARFIAIGT